jgi:RNA polymerase sigma-70 factor (ECF subfamily)
MREKGTWTDEELAREAGRGDVEAFDLLVRRYLRPATALAWQFVRSLEDAEDVVQAAFHRTVRALGSYDASRPFGAWFYAIVRNVARTAIREDARRAALAPLSLPDDEPAAPVVEDPVIAGDVERALETLPPMQQTCVRLCDMEGFTSVEAARMLGVGDVTVRTHLYRARRQLRAAMASYRGRLP